MSLRLSTGDTLHVFVFALAVLETFTWLCVNEVEVTWEYFFLVKDRQNVNIKLSSKPRKGSICQFCTEPTVGTLGMQKNKQIRTDVSSQGKYSAWGVFTS